MSINMRSINIKSNNGIFDGEITLFVHNASVLETILEKIQKINGVTDIKRTYTHSS